MTIDKDHAIGIARMIREAAPEVKLGDIHCNCHSVHVTLTLKEPGGHNTDDLTSYAHPSNALWLGRLGDLAEFVLANFTDRFEEELKAETKAPDPINNFDDFVKEMDKQEGVDIDDNGIFIIGEDHEPEETSREEVEPAGDSR